jgi:putative two-component system response regulator
MAVADVFDALISVRVYKKAMTYEEARNIIVAGRGKHFDPDMVDAFLASFGKWCAIADRYSDATGEIVQ